MKIKLTNMLRGKERQKRKNRYARLNRGRWRRFIYMASLIWWMWVWANSRSWWWTGRPGVLRFMGSQRVGHDWVTRLNWTDFPFESHLPVSPFPHTHQASLKSSHPGHLFFNALPSHSQHCYLASLATTFLKLLMFSNKLTENQGRWPRGAIPSPRSGGCVGKGGLRGATPRSRSGGAAVRRYPSSKVRSSGCTLLEQLWRDTPRSR